MLEYTASRTSSPPVVINNVALIPIEHDGARVVTLAMIDKVHGRPDGTAGRNFRENRAHLIEGEDYREVTQPDEIRRLGLERPQGGVAAKVIICTETGYLMLVKSFTDELAWQVQRSLVKSYFAAPAAPALRQRRFVDADKQRRTFDHHLKIASMIGLSGNQAVLSANRATVALTGIDTLNNMGAAQLRAPRNEALLTPTDIGQMSEIGSARAVNARLCLLGLQRQVRDAKGRSQYEPTDTGVAAGAVMQDAGKRHGDGTPVRQLKWSSSILAALREAAA